MKKALAPSKRVYHSILYDSKTDRILLFGGQAYYHWGMDLQDLWSFDLNSLQWEYVGELVAGEVYSMAYDEENQRAIMLNLKGETWVYHVGSRSWEKRCPLEAPSARYGQRMIYEAHTGRVLLFGGFTDRNVDAPQLNQTWAYDYTADSWSLMDLKSSPPARSYHSMVYHPIAEKTLVWGGRPFSMRADVTAWTLDSRTASWQPLPPATGPNNRYTYASMIYCPKSSQVVMFGGLDLTGQFEGRLVDETWLFELETNKWKRAETLEGPTGRSQHAMAYAATEGKVIIMGGETGGAYAGQFTNELWFYDPLANRWEEVQLTDL